VDDLIDNIGVQEASTLKVITSMFLPFESKDLIPIKDYSPSIIKPEITKFSDEKTYLDTSCVNEIDPIDYSYKVTFENRPLRANMQPTIGSVWTAKMKGSFKVLNITELDKTILNSCILSTGFLGVQSSQNLPASFLFALFTSGPFRAKKDLISTGATMEAINNKDFLSLMVPNATVKEMTAFDQTCSPILLRLSSLREEKQRLVAIKQQLLTKYFLNRHIS
jgi:type I restriction enzyme S subunit